MYICRFIYHLHVLDASVSTTLQLMHYAAVCPPMLYSTIVILRSLFSIIYEQELLPLIFHSYIMRKWE